MSSKQVLLGSEIAKQFTVISTAIRSLTYEALDPLMAVVNDVFTKIRDGSNVFGQQFIVIGESLKSLGRTFSETFDTFANSTIFSGLVANLNIVIMTVDMLLFVFNKLFAGIELSLTGITLLLNGTIKKMGDFLVMMEDLQAKATKFLGTGDNNPKFKAFFEGLRDSGAKDFERDLERIEVLKKKLLGEWKAPELKLPTVPNGNGKAPGKTPTTPTEKKEVAESIIPVNEIKTASLQAQAEIQTLFNFVQYSFSPQKFTIWQAFSDVTPIKNGLALVQKEISATQAKNLAIIQSNYDAQQQALDQNYVEMFVSDEEYLKQTQALRTAYETEKQSVIKQGVDAEIQANKSASEAFAQSIENRKEALSGLLSATQTVWGAITTTASAFGSLQDTLHQNEMTNLQEQGDKRIALLQEQMSQATMSSRAKILAEKRIADLQKKNEAEAQSREKAYNEKKKGWAITQVTIDGAMAIANIWKDWASNPVMAGILTGLSVATTTAQIATISAQKFANGGIIGGANGASYGQDNTMVSARKGEMIINAPQQRDLWETIRGNKRGSSSQPINVSMPVTINGNVDRGTLAKLKEQQNDFLQQLEGGLRTLSGKGRLSFAGGRL